MGRPSARPAMAGYPPASSASLADVLERVLDKGIVIAGDIRINLLDIELLTVKLRILIASVDKAKEMGIDWWEHDPSLSSRGGDRSLAAENRRLRAELDALHRGGPGTGTAAGAETTGAPAARGPGTTGHDSPPGPAERRPPP
ncbi:gas vesicle protein [Streptomyces bambusae]|uniref:gas vesicle protein n=1 Tax=Streptomyces bambusae TaxID=1550616 RepID=UPI001CFF0503|nr:gas vesicle protein [Streptomyces bambusae]MCB5164269.1 gas vesicle protein [Streptomyces bambusae]